MTPFTAYKNEFTGKAHQTAQACLKSECDHLRKMVHVAIDSTLLLPWLDFGKQCDYIRTKIDDLEAKAREYQAAMAKGKIVHTDTEQRSKLVSLASKHVKTEEQEAA